MKWVATRKLYVSSCDRSPLRDELLWVSCFWYAHQVTHKKGCSNVWKCLLLIYIEIYNTPCMSIYRWSHIISRTLLFSLFQPSEMYSKFEYTLIHVVSCLYNFGSIHTHTHTHEHTETHMHILSLTHTHTERKRYTTHTYLLLTHKFSPSLTT